MFYRHRSPGSRVWSIETMQFLAATVAAVVALFLTDAQFARAADPKEAKGGPITVRVMSFNLWHGGEEGRQPLAQTVKVIEAARADIVGLQETLGHERNGKKPDNAEKIANKLGWNFLDQGDGTAVISRWKIVESTPRKWGVKIALPGDRFAWIFNAHFPASPYQPYQLLKIPYNDAPFVDDEAGAIREARAARGENVERMIAEIRGVLAQGTPVFVTGDFNEPCVLDWTDPVARAGRCPVQVDWPTTKAVLDLKFVDAYRAAHPDPLKAPGYTWTSTTSEDDPKDRHDRIDFVFVGGRGAKVLGAEVVGEKPARADIVVAPYPSDHRAAIATVRID